MSKVVEIFSFILLVVGTLGLLLNEFATHWGRVATLSFALANVMGLLILGINYWMKKVTKSD